jgi:hypothetical protein
MTTVIASPLLAEGLRTEFADTYTKIRNRQMASQIAQLMDISIGATNRQHTFGYFNAAPHAEFWRRGDPVPRDSFGSVTFVGRIHEFARRVSWSKFDREDDQTQSLMDAARMAGESFGLIPERIFFDLLNGTTTALPFVPLAPDGVGFFSATDGSGGNRFGLSGGNLVSGSGVATVSAILANYYTALSRFMLFQDGKGQPLLDPAYVQGGVVVVAGAGNLQAFETAFMQMRQGIVYGSNTAAAAVSNIVQDAARNVELFITPRISDNDWYVFLKSPPKKATFHLERKAVQPFEALEGNNNSDSVRDSAEEYIQWESREGGGIALPYGAIKIDN